jgi:hypothetical protein
MGFIAVKRYNETVQ